MKIIQDGRNEERKRQSEKATGSQSNGDDEGDVKDLIKIALGKLDDLAKKVDKNSKTCDEKFVSCEFEHGNNSDKIENLAKEIGALKSEMNTLKKENAALNKTVKALSTKVSEFDLRLEMKDREAKKNNICIEGVVEKENLSMEKLLDDLFTDLGLDNEGLKCV